MKFTGEKTSPERQAQALRNVESFIEVLKKKRPAKLLKIAQKSWRTSHDVNQVNIPDFKTLELKIISFFSGVVIDAFIEFNAEETKTFRIRFVSEDAPYKVSDKADFLFNPLSIKLWS